MRKILLLAAWAGCLWAADPRAELLAKAKAIRSVRADLAQSLSVMGQSVEMQGQAWFKVPDRLRVELALSLGDVQVGTLTVSDGKTLTIYQDLFQTVQKVDLARLGDPGTGVGPEVQDPSDPFKGFVPDSIRYLAEESLDGIPCALFEARLKQSAQAGGLMEMDRARLWLGRGDAFPRRMILMDRQGKEVMRQTYTNIRINAAMADDLFVFVPPPGAKVNDGTGAVLDLLQEASPPSTE
jgi:outer membrane lipoprotein-sorting protein